MSKLSKALQAAAGNSSAETPAVENVFNTYVYTGTGGALGGYSTFTNGLNLNEVGYGTSLKFTGSQYLQRADLSGNTDGKTFTFSAWVLLYSASSAIYSSDTNGAGNGFTVMYVSSNLQLRGYNSAGQEVASFNLSNTNFPIGRFFHLLISVDLTNSSNRYVYIDGTAVTPTWTAYDGSSNIDFTRTLHTIGRRYTDYSIEGQLAHVYLDYTYRDLSDPSNRAIFVDSKGGSVSPSSLAALNPIMYLPLTNDYSNGQNLGTGGNFTAYGSQSFSVMGTESGTSGPQKALTWIKKRDGTAANHMLFDTERRGYIHSNLTNANTSTFSVNFFPGGIGIPYSTTTNLSASEYAAWTFKASERFFDCVTWTGTGTPQNISHNLGVTPGCIIIKSLSITGNWWVWHRTLPDARYGLYLNGTSAQTTSNTTLDWTDPTDTVFRVGTSALTNSSGANYVAYLFAHDPLGPSGDGSDGMISCGSYTGTGSAGSPSINLGWEPQWLLVKNATAAGDWWMFDNMRGMFATPGDEPAIKANFTNPETDYLSDYLTPRANGFEIQSSGTDVNNTGATYIYIAIRRGPMLAPESGTDVFLVDQGDTTTSNPQFRSTFPVDVALWRATTSTDWKLGSRLTERYYVATNSAVSQVGPTTDVVWDYMNGFYYDVTNTTTYAWMWRRAPGFMDAVVRTGTGSNVTNKHNLGVAPELIITKERTASNEWYVSHSFTSTDYKRQYLDLTNAETSHLYSANFIYTAQPTNTSIFFTNNGNVNQVSQQYIDLLFATLPGVSKVGRYTGNGTSQTIDCDFTSGARFVMIKRTDSTGDWYVWDTVRGITASNDPRLSLNSSAAQVTTDDSLDPDSSGFIVNQVAATNINVSSASYIYLAIA